jgi:hypothetical protein
MTIPTGGEMSELSMTQPRSTAGAGNDPITEAERIIDAASGAGIVMRVTGGVAIAMLCERARVPPLRRTYQDIDFAMRSHDATPVAELFAELGYAPEEEFNLLHGQRRLFFVDPARGLQADVFLDRIEMCHQLDIGDRLERREATLTPADLLLSKLQVMQTNDKDYLDMIALLSDLPLTEGDDRGIDLQRIREICSADWGWWRTATLVGARTRQFAQELSVRHPDVDPAVVDRVTTLLNDLEQTPKSRKWKLRARVGERVRWHEEPEDIDHDLENV